MKKLFLTLTFILSCITTQAHSFIQNGNYLSKSGELIFRITTDSLYIDIAQSRRNISKFKLIKKRETSSTISYNAFESYLKDNYIVYREVLIRISRLKEDEYLLEYFGQDKDRDYTSNERYHIFLLK